MGDNMDWIAINTGCFTVSNSIAKTSLSLCHLVREVREARPDLDMVASLVNSLDTVLDLLKDDAAEFPSYLAQMTPAVLDKCHYIVNELEGCLAVLGRSDIPRAEKQSRWLAGRDHVEKLRGTLEGYRATLALAVDLMAMTNTCRNTGRGHCELASLSARIRQTKTHLQSESRENAAFLILLRYLDALDEFTRSSSHALQPHSQSRPSVGEHQEAPDSAIEMSDDDGKAFLSKSPRNTAAARRLEMAGFLDELSEMPSQVPSQAPVPPPKSRARASSIGLGPGALNGRQLHSAVRAETAPVPGRYEHRRGWSFSGVGPSQTYSGRDVQGQSPVEIRIQPPTTTPAAVSLWRPTWEDQPSSARPSTSGSGLSINQPRQNSFPQIKRSNSRLASAFRSLSLRRKSSPPPPAPTMEFPTAVFGVPLAESILVARGLAGTQHSGGGRSSREYPLCVLRCVYFLRSSPPSSSSSSLSVSSGGGNSSGISTPDIFGQDIRILDPNTEVSLAKLKEIFNSPASLYGKILDWTPFTAHDAANLILLYLSELPTPLIPLSIARRWVVLSRQSTIRGSLSTRLDQGLDFWEEAFSGVYGPSRALFKLLLNLWGEVVQVAYVNDMTAERLAQNLMGPLLHLRREGEVQGSEYTDVLLGLAFIIRKRQEYNLALGGRSAPV